ncbi:hypothetical protein ACWD7C_06540 [Streptomyces sp. NPDC005134]|uniref:hypothetical protein n=1 Tax=Streptomyces sp. NPDC005098 TaxID=3154560 RepID=UPI0033B5562A
MPSQEERLVLAQSGLCGGLGLTDERPGRLNQRSAVDVAQLLRDSVRTPVAPAGEAETESEPEPEPVK